MRGMCLEQWTYASTTDITTRRSGPRPVAGATSSQKGSDPAASRRNSSFSTIRACPLTWSPILPSVKSTKRSPTCGFSEILPRPDITQLPRYSGYARVFSSSTRMKPANPARKEVSASPCLSAVPTNIISCLVTKACMEGVEVVEYLMPVKGTRARRCIALFLKLMLPIRPREGNWFDDSTFLHNGSSGTTSL